MASEERVYFDERQQTKVDALIDAAYAKGRRKGAQEAQAEITTLNAEIDALKNKKTFAFWRK